MEKCLHWWVRGRVQGVWFRASTKTTAQQLGVKGWVKNLPDGRVEVMAVGDEKQLAELHEWLKKGPELAEVIELTVEELPYYAYQTFEVL